MSFHQFNVPFLNKSINFFTTNCTCTSKGLDLVSTGTLMTQLHETQLMLQHDYDFFIFSNALTIKNCWAALLNLSEVNY